MSTVSIPQILPSISLFYKEGSSDKEYHLTVMGNEAEGFRVQYRYGKRGSALKAKFKNVSPVDFETAIGIYNGIEAEKRREGYTPCEAGTPYVGTEGAGKVSGLLPQLLNEISEDEAMDLLNDDDWVMQEKKNGVRKIIRKVKKTIEGINKKGLVTALPETVVDAVKESVGSADVTFDSELVGEICWMFDLLSIAVHAYSDKSLGVRLQAMQEWFGDGLNTPNLKMIPTAVGTSSKKALFKKLKAENAEGVVFKRLDSVYKPGRPASGGTARKFKFYATATVRCKFLNKVASFRMEMLSKGDWVEVGDCTYYPTIYTPKPGDFVEVRYMYAFQGGSLYGPPVLLEQRTDQNDSDCGVSQLKYKQEVGEEEEG